jgi:hypothetical protein
MPSGALLLEGKFNNKRTVFIMKILIINLKPEKRNILIRAVENTRNSVH